jgi:WhiB family redox-sensing transcriptional regulator
MARISSPGWMGRAACRNIDIDIFFPVTNEGLDKATAVCRDCLVRQECLTFALENSELSGVWGGTSDRQRVGLRGRADR